MKDYYDLWLLSPHPELSIPTLRVALGKVRLLRCPSRKIQVDPRIDELWLVRRSRSCADFGGAFDRQMKIAMRLPSAHQPAGK